MRAKFEPTDLSAFSAEIASAFRSVIEKAGLRFSVHCSNLSHTTYIDRDMWEKILLNLLSNAFKFTMSSEIAVSVRLSATADGRGAHRRYRDRNCPRTSNPLCSNVSIASKARRAGVSRAPASVSLWFRSSCDCMGASIRVESPLAREHLHIRVRSGT